MFLLLTFQLCFMDEGKEELGLGGRCGAVPKNQKAEQQKKRTR